MGKNHINTRTAPRRALAWSLAATLALAGGLQAGMVMKTFDSAESAAATPAAAPAKPNPGTVPTTNSQRAWRAYSHHPNDIKT